tara:strand:- start:48864 stop:49490 length:627 start_codon:yes stop_codon:yes gene_type:complete
MSFIAVVFMTLVLIYRNVKNSGITSKSGRELRNIRKKINDLDNKIDELNSLQKDRIIDSEQLKFKINNVLLEKESLMNSYNLRGNIKYKKIKKAEEKGLIDKNESEFKINELQYELKQKVTRPDNRRNSPNQNLSKRQKFELGTFKISDSFYHKCYKVEQGNLEIFGLIESRNYIGDNVKLNNKKAPDGVYEIDWYNSVKVLNGVIAE